MKTNSFEIQNARGLKYARVGIKHLTCRKQYGLFLSGMRCACTTRFPLEMINKRDEMNYIFMKYKIPCELEDNHETIYFSN